MIPARVNIVTLGVRDLPRVHAFYESLCRRSASNNRAVACSEGRRDSPPSRQGTLASTTP